MLIADISDSGVCSIRGCFGDGHKDSEQSVRLCSVCPEPDGEHEMLDETVVSECGSSGVWEVGWTLSLL